MVNIYNISKSAPLLSAEIALRGALWLVACWVILRHLRSVQVRATREGLGPRPADETLEADVVTFATNQRMTTDSS